MSRPTIWFCSLAALLVLVACGDDDGRGVDGGVGPGVDGGARDGAVPGTDSGVFPDGCVPRIELCGDRMDQNCDGMDTSCGDSDGDGIMACREGDDLTMCDCDDSRTDVRPAFGTVPGAPELCDGRDNDCNGRVDESAECCAGCGSLDDHTRADVCLEDGTCDCSTADGVGPCPAGETCCGGGCTSLATDFDNCGFCGTMCTTSADTCAAGVCRCGTGPVCDLDYPCTAGTCGT